MGHVTVESKSAASARGEGSPASEQASEWTGTASNAGLLGVAAFIVLEGAVLQLVLYKHPVGAALLTAVHVLMVIALELQSRVEVHIGPKGLSIRYGRLRLVRQSVPLERILAARATQLDPVADHGGWGYRGSLALSGKAAVVVRAGSALTLELQGGKRFVISVDGADTAARHLRCLLERCASSPAAPSASASGADPSG